MDLRTSRGANGISREEQEQASWTRDSYSGVRLKKDLSTSNGSINQSRKSTAMLMTVNTSIEDRLKGPIQTLCTPSTPRIELSRASSSSHQEEDSRSSSPENLFEQVYPAIRPTLFDINKRRCLICLILNIHSFIHSCIQSFSHLLIYYLPLVVRLKCIFPIFRRLLWIEILFDQKSLFGVF